MVFRPSFFQHFWRIVRKEVIEAIKYIFREAIMPACWKNTFVSLIPKKQNPAAVSDYRPISLCDIVYKVAAKILVNRMKPILPSLVSGEQGAFIPGRNNRDNILVAQEIMHSLMHAPPSRCLMAFKVDMEKAYDTMAVLVNGSPTNWFQTSRGLRQGCPLSPYLYILCSDMLSLMFTQAVQWKLLRAYRVGAGLQVSHIFYADDLLLVNRASIKDCICVEAILEAYCNMSGQAVAEKTGTWRYLGVPLSGDRLSATDYSFLEESTAKRIESWTWKALTFAGRATLLQSVLASLPLYILASIHVPIGVLESIEKQHRAFLWGHAEDRKGLHLISWKKNMFVETEWRFGIDSLIQRKEEFLCKMAAQLILNPESLWAKVVSAKYKFNGTWTNYVQPARCTIIWAKIVEQGPKIQCHFLWSIGAGNSVSVLNDPWITPVLLSRLPIYINMDVNCEQWRGRDSITTERQGDESKLLELFPIESTNLIKTIPLPQGDWKDQLGWGTSRSSKHLKDLCGMNVQPSSLPELEQLVLDAQISTDLQQLVLCLGGLIQPGNSLWNWGAINSVNLNPKKSVLVCWLPPPINVLMLNFDASVAIQELHITQLWIEGDSLTVIKWLTQSKLFEELPYPLLQDLLSWKRSLHMCRISRVFREANRAADCLANKASWCLNFPDQCWGVTHVLKCWDIVGSEFAGGKTSFYLWNHLSAGMTEGSWNQWSSKFNLSSVMELLVYTLIGDSQFKCFQYPEMVLYQVSTAAFWYAYVKSQQRTLEMPDSICCYCCDAVPVPGATFGLVISVDGMGIYVVLGVSGFCCNKLCS
ncbi:uncharacterized protein [Elaeis guineensis]|uniref:uncharacterized protein n=1 Tax=Elaeis guineensis var. tenera TaxID=51953 RepID=UPI003C6D06E6